MNNERSFLTFSLAAIIVVRASTALEACCPVDDFLTFECTTAHVCAVAQSLTQAMRPKKRKDAWFIATL